MATEMDSRRPIRARERRWAARIAGALARWGVRPNTINLMGFAGGLCMSAIKRDRGIKDFGAMIEGHGGILDRIDSICFAAPVFFHLTRYYFT